MKLQLVVALKLLRNFFLKRAIAVQPCHLVLVLVRHQLEQVARHCFAKAGPTPGSVGLLHLIDQRLVAVSVSSVLVGCQKRHPLDDQFSQGRFFDKHHGLRGRKQGQHGRQIVGAVPAPFKRRLVMGHLHAIKFHRPHQRSAAQWHAPVLPGVTEQQRIGVNRVTQCLPRHLFGIEQTQCRCANDIANGGFTSIFRERPIGVVDKRRRWSSVGIEGDVGTPGLHHRQCGFAGRHNGIASNHQIGPGGFDLAGENLPG
ncbi:hypothetical protein GALL_513520 [mine drainage metagenome]|uniref:Uncharacterized protein n=1 Tax=mine drainage metagenome TaxID=410659 RepID=A0A1J5P7A0_9ZZZZ